MRKLIAITLISVMLIPASLYIGYVWGMSQVQNAKVEVFIEPSEPPIEITVQPVEMEFN